jgi:hypothetical protein
VSLDLTILADAAAAGLAGLDGRYEWGSAATIAPDTGERPPAAATIALGPAPGVDADLHWLAGPAAGDDAAPRVTAPAGEGLWSRALRPARDELFELDPPAPDAGVLVVSGDLKRREAVVGQLTGGGVAAEGVHELTVERLAAAATVAFLPEEIGESVMPATAPAVLAARRHLIAPRCRVAFGLLAGTDHLAADDDGGVVQYAHAVSRFPASFRMFTVFGRVAAEPWRASVLYGRVVSDLVAEPS